MNKKILGLVMATAICGTIVLSLPMVATAETAIVIPGHGSDIVQTDLPDVTTENVKKIIPNILAWIFGIFITITALMIIIAGLLFVTGGGKPEQTTKARQVLIYALVGLAVALLAQGIMKLLETFVTTGNM